MPAALEADSLADGDSSPRAAVVCERLGHWVSNLDGKNLGFVVSDTKKFWKLSDGKVVQKAAHGKKWQWMDKAPTPAATPTGSFSNTCSSPEVSFVLPPAMTSPKSGGYSPRKATVRLGANIRGVGGALWGRVVAEEFQGWRLDTGHIAKKVSENVQWRWDDTYAIHVELEGLELPPSADLEDHTGWDGLPQAVLFHIYEWLSLRSALRAAASSRRWAQSAAALPVELPPPQVDALLQFCLLQVLQAFDETRLPLPMTAIYAEMRAAARKALAGTSARHRMESMVLQSVGRSCLSAQKDLLAGLAAGRCHRHHISWMPDVKTSGHRTLERMARHFHSMDLIEVTKQRWHKRIHHSPNTRTCIELLLTGVNRSHPLFLEHEAWALQKTTEGTEFCTQEAADQVDWQGRFT